MIQRYLISIDDKNNVDIKKKLDNIMEYIIAKVIALEQLEQNIDIIHLRDNDIMSIDKNNINKMLPTKRGLYDEIIK